MGVTVKEERIEIRLASADKERIRQAAVLRHQSVSEFILRVVRTEAADRKFLLSMIQAWCSKLKS